MYGKQQDFFRVSQKCLQAPKRSKIKIKVTGRIPFGYNRAETMRRRKKTTAIKSEEFPLLAKHFKFLYYLNELNKGELSQNNLISR